LKDLFIREQQILDDALRHINELRSSGLSVSKEMFENLVGEYGMLLKQLRKIVKISDKSVLGLINNQKLWQEQITDLVSKVHYDILTGIYNRRYMEEVLNNSVETMQRSDGGIFSVLMLDIDFFKEYNDTYGHADGDACLRIVAGAIEDCITRDEDFAARYGGEEFAVILPNTGEGEARMIAERILENVRTYNIPHKKSKVAPYVTVSVGVATGDVRNVRNSIEYIKRADEALYISKRNGRDRYILRVKIK